MRALIFGADGFLGANLVKHLLSQGHEVVGTALNRKGETSLDALNVRCRIEYGDVLDERFCERVVNAYEAQWVFHLAAVSIVRVAEASPARALKTNVLGTLNVLEACRQKSVKAMVVASSDKAYGDHKGERYVEDAPLTPTGTYEVSKACADHITRLYGRTYGVPAMVTRCANLYGPGDLNWSRLIPGACKKAVAGLSPEVHPGSWHHQREWIDVESACRAYETIAEKGQPGEAYNVGSGQTDKTGTIASLIAMQLGALLPIEKQGTSGFYEIQAQVLNSAKLWQLGWTPEHDQAKALHKTVEWYARYLRGER